MFKACGFVLVGEIIINITETEITQFGVVGDK